MDKDAFITELKELLRKYNASINFDCSAYSDLHAVYDEHLVIEFGNEVICRTLHGTPYIEADSEFQ